MVHFTSLLDLQTGIPLYFLWGRNVNMKNVLRLLKIVSTCVVSLSFVLLAFSLIGVLTKVHAVSVRATALPATATLLVTPTPIHKHKHKHTVMPPSTPTTEPIVTPTAIAVLATPDSMPSKAPEFPFMSALLGTLISAGSALLLSLLFIGISRRNTARNNLPLVESQETLPFNETFLPTPDASAPSDQPQILLNETLLPTADDSTPTDQLQISFNDVFLSDPRNLPTR